MTHAQTQGADGAGTKTAGGDLPRNKWGEPDHHPIIGHWHVRHEIKAAADTGYMFGKNFVRLADAIDFCEQQSGQCRLLFHIDGEGWLRIDRPFQSYYVGDATPAPAATPGVPDSLRAQVAAAIGRVMCECGPGLATGMGCFEKAADAVLALIAAQPAGQAGDAGADAMDAARFRALMRCGRIKMQGSAGVDADTGTLKYPDQPGSVHFGAEFWPQSEGEADRHTIWGRHCLRALADDILALEGRAHNSTRTGAAETEDCPDVAYQRGKEDGYSEGVLDAAARAGLTLEYGVSSDPERHVPGPVEMLQRIAEHTDALAARPEAPSDAGWSREDLEAFVAREWPEGRSAGAAARELVRALGARGLAPTLQRLLTDLLGQINFASTDRAQILADFANAAPEAARMAKIDSFERWNPRVFDPTPPSDPAPSGQAEG